MNRVRVCLSLVALSLFTISCNHVSDDTIATDIKAKMFSEPLLKSSAVNVTSKDGIVTITGTVHDDAARLAAEQIASKTNGVKQVIDSTTMAPPQTAENFTPPPPKPTRAPAPPKHKKEKHAPETPATPDPPAAPDTADTNPGPIAPPAPVTPVVAAAPAPAPPPPPPPPKPITITIPEGTVVTVRTIDAIDSSTASAGQSFTGSLDAPVSVDGQVVLPRGLNARLKITAAESAGKFKGRSELTVALDTITYQGKVYTFATSDVQQKGASRGKRSAEVIGGGAVLGAIIGGIAGGGKGAAIGSAAGAGAGTVVQATTHGQKVKIPSETKLDFTLHAPVDITYLPAKRSYTRPPSSDNSARPADQTQQQQQ